MRALEVYNGALRLCELSVPAPAAGEVLIRVAYVGVNRADLMQINGQYDAPPGASPLPGLEVSGWIVACGQNVQNFVINDEVCSLLDGGGYAEYAIAPAAQTLPLPAGISLQQAATLPEAAATSILALCEAGALQPGQRVLIHGGTSGLGVLMAQIARALGAEVFASVGSPAKAELLRGLGITPLDNSVDNFYNLLNNNYKNTKFDVIIDTLGGPQWENHLRLLQPGGRLVSLAMLEGSALPEGAKMTRLLMQQLTWRGVTLRHQPAARKAALMADALKTLWPKLADGSIKPITDHVFAFPDAEKALLRMQERLHIGKILLEVAAN